MGGNLFGHLQALDALVGCLGQPADASAEGPSGKTNCAVGISEATMAKEVGSHTSLSLLRALHKGSPAGLHMCDNASHRRTGGCGAPNMAPVQIPPHSRKFHVTT